MKFIVFNIIFLFIIHCNPFLPEGSSKDNLIRITAFNTQKSSPKPVYSIKGNLLSPGGETVKNASLNVSAGSLSTTTSVKKEITGGTSVVSEKAPGKLDFVDIDPTKGKIAGPVKIAKAVDETEINFYSLYWASAENQKLSRITKLWKTGASSYIYMLNLGTSPPNGAKYLLAVSGNNTKGEETSGSNKLINDTQAKFLTDENGQYEMKLNPGSFKVTIVSESGVELGEISVSLPETITADTPPPTPVATSGTMVMTVTAFGEDGSDAKPVVFTSPTHAAEALNFTDTDGNKGYIAGNLSITKASDETDVTTYAVYFGSSATEIIGNPIAILSKTNQNISYTLASTAIPAMATHLLAFTKNGTVQMSTGVSTAISDLISPPTLTASSLNFSDSDVSVGKIGGILTIGKASDESNITSYALYWGTNSSTKLSHITDLAATGTNLSYTFNTNTSIPSGATHFLVFTKNSAGESTNPFSLA
ncbi:MAG: hypothetical protein KDK45_22395, partial [Leptospiraceae bacterium]|nr:hypothetical protein [Leptospiraceae bacterium]